MKMLMRDGDPFIKQITKVLRICFPQNTELPKAARRTGGRVGCGEVKNSLIQNMQILSHEKI
jgi:hypothetical protein